MQAITGRVQQCSGCAMLILCTHKLYRIMFYCLILVFLFYLKAVYKRIEAIEINRKTFESQDQTSFNLLGRGAMEVDGLRMLGDDDVRSYLYCCVGTCIYVCVWVPSHN